MSRSNDSILSSAARQKSRQDYFLGRGQTEKALGYRVGSEGNMDPSELSPFFDRPKRGGPRMWTLMPGSDIIK